MSHRPGSTRHPRSLRLSLLLIRVASIAVPRVRRSTWLRQWNAELIHRWQRRANLEPAMQRSTRGVLACALGAFRHALYLFRTEYTMDIIWQDVKYGLRALRRGKGLIAVAVLSLGIGIGANASIFSAVDVFMLRPLPYPDSHELHTVWITNRERGWNQVSFSVPDYLDLHAQSQTMQLAASTGGTFSLSGGDRAERLRGRYVTPEFFPTLGVAPSVGRGFLSEEGQPGNDKVAIISHGLWVRRFGGDPDLLGRAVILDGESHVVVGVMPPNFWFLYPGVDVWVPLSFSGEEQRGGYFLTVLGRLNEGYTTRQAEEEAQRFMQGIATEYPETSAGHSAMLLTLHEDVFDEGFKAGSLIATVGVALVLLIACANVANLLLTHASGRSREVALRGALGAGRSRIARQFLTEAIMVAAAGGLLGVGLSVLGIRGLLSITPPEFPRIHEIGLNPRVLLYTVAITVFTGIIFGLVPALQSSKPNMIDTLKEGGRSGTAGKGARLRKSLVVGEVALALVLLVSSALLVKGFVRIRLADLGFDRSDVLSMQIMLTEHEYPDSSSVAAFHEQLAARLASIPGVETVGATTILPLQGNSSTYYALAGEDYNDPEQRKVTNYRSLVPGYFEAMDIPILRGRGIENGDRAGMPRVAVINQTMAELHWPGKNPIGQQLQFGLGPREIVGVVADTRDGGADARLRPLVYFAVAQGIARFMDWAIESSAPLESLVEPVRDAVRSLDPNVAVYDVMPLDALIVRSLGGDLIMAKLMAAVAVIALILALGGVYGVMAYTVSQRTQELGIRMALGAQTSNVLAMVVRQGTVLALVGVFVGVAVALGVTRGLSRFLFGVSPFDPAIFVAVALALLSAGLAATFFPALRATRVDPIVALRVE
jgi:putative ABC transport system permease protein